MMPTIKARITEATSNRNAGSGTDDLPLRLARCTAGLVRTARDMEWRSPDPYDGLYWKWPAALIATPRRRQVVAQLHARAPVDIRAWRRGPRPRLAKTLALFASSALLADDVLHADDLRAAGRQAAEELHADRSAGKHAWGYPFPVQTRWSSYEANSPNVVVTSFAVDALLLAAERFNEAALADRARHAGEWLTESLLTAHGHFAYHEHSDALIHNANLLGAAAVYRTLGDAQPVLQAVELALQAQRPDGSWPYGEGAGLGFVDNFHTAYILTSLNFLRDVDSAIDAAIERGAHYWSESFFDDRGRARLWPNRRFPEDGHSTGTALSTLALLAQRGPAYYPLLERVAERALRAMMAGGRAVHRRHRWGRTRVGYLRWCDGHVAAGMGAGACSLLAGHPQSRFEDQVN